MKDFMAWLWRFLFCLSPYEPNDFRFAIVIISFS